MAFYNARASKSPYTEENAHAEMFDIVFGARNLAQIVRCAALFSFAEHLAGKARSAEDVAQAEGLNGEATNRLLRACAAFGLARMEEGGGYSGTPLLATLRKDDPAALYDVAISQEGLGHWASWGRLDQAVRTGERQTEAALGRDVWEYYGSAEGAVEAAAFSRAMAGGVPPPKRTPPNSLTLARPPLQSTWAGPAARSCTP